MLAGPSIFEVVDAEMEALGAANCGTCFGMKQSALNLKLLSMKNKPCLE